MKKKPVVQAHPEIKSEVKSISDFSSLWSFAQRNWLYFAIPAALVVVVYLNSLPNGFVSDDKGLQQEGSNMLSYRFIFGTEYGGPLGFLRYLLYAIIFVVGGVNAFLFRFSNILFHLGNTVLLFSIITLLSKKRIALLAASLFAVHPILLESVTWISGGGYAQYSFFFLVSFLLYIFADRAGKRNYYYFSLGAFVLALLSFNRAMTLAPVFFLYELAFGDIKKHWKRTLPYLGLSMIWALVYGLQLASRVQLVTKGTNVTNTTYNPLFQIPFSISSYLYLMVWPDQLSFYHSNIQTTPAEMVLRWLVLLTLIGGIIYSFFKNKTIFFWLSFFVVSIAIYLLPLQIAWLVAERYVYIGTIGILVLIALFFNWLLKFKKANVFIYIVFFTIVSLLGVRTIIRNFDWQNEDTLMTSTLRTNPENAKVHNHIGTIYGRKKDYVNAMKEFEIAQKLDPELPDSYHNMGNAFYEQKMSDKAIPLLEKALQVDPNHWESYQLLANIYYDLGDFKKVAENIQKILPINPNPALYSNLGIIYLKLGDKEKAKEAFTMALKLDPNQGTAAQALSDLNNGGTGLVTTPTQDNPGNLPPEVLKAIQEQTQKQSVSTNPTTK